MERLLTELVERLKKACGDRLVSVILYGSAAARDHLDQFSDLNVVCVLSQVGVRELGDSAAVLRWWREKGNPSPLLLSEDEFRHSTDCFAIEFHDIRAQRRVLYGPDLAAELEVDNSFYRAQVEQELRGKLLRLRQKVGGVLADKKLLRGLLADSLSTFCVLMRHALILDGAAPGTKKREIIALARERLGLNPESFETLLDMREGKLKESAVDPGPLLEAYLREISRVIDVVDRLEK